MNLTELFCDVDDFCHQFMPILEASLLGQKRRRRSGQLSASEIMTILIHFHQAGYRNFKAYYQEYVLVHLKGEFPNLISYSRFISLVPRHLVPLLAFLKQQYGSCTGISFIDSTPLAVCHQRRIERHRVFANFAQRGKNSMGWFFGFKLHLAINERGQLLACQITPGNVDDRTPVPQLTRDLWGKLFADRGYISKQLAQQLLEQDLHLITRVRKNMTQPILSMTDKLLLRKRAIVETVIDQLKNISQIEHTRHRSPMNCFVNIICGLIAYCYQPKKPALFTL